MVNQQRSEGALEIKLRALVEEAGLSGVHYEAFDFHKECAKMQYGK